MSDASTKEDLQNKPQTIKEILVPLIAIIIGLFMVILDGTAMNVALPGLITEFESPLSTVQWIVTAYALAMAAVIPLAGWMSDRFGAKNIFIISIALFTIGSLLCAMAGSINQLIIFRILQALGGGMVMPIAMAFTYRLSPPGKVGAVMGVMGIPILLAPALGPVLSGWLVEFASWKWIFIINLPIGIIGILVAIRSLPVIKRQAVATLDVLGMIFGPLAFAALAYGVSEGGMGSWTSLKTLLGIGIGILSLIIFIIVELRHSNPMLELRVFRSKDFSRGIVIQWISQFALFGTMFLIPLFLQQAKGYGAFETGLIMLPQAIAAGIFMPISGYLFDKIGARPVVMSGLAIVTVAALLLTQISAEDGIASLMLPLALLGAGMGLSMMPLNTHLIQSAPQNLVGRVTSLTNAAQQVVTSFAVAGLTTIIASRASVYMTSGTKSELEIAASSFGDTFIVLVGIGIVGTVLSLMLRKPKKLVEDSEEPAEATMMMHG